jgi:hypothetical protein
VYCATSFENSYGVWERLLQYPSAQLCGTLGSQARSRLSDQYENQPTCLLCAYDSRVRKVSW